VVAWTVVFLIAGDVALGRVFRPPSDPRTPPTSLQRYFEYGRSVEGKLRLMVREDDEHSAPAVVSGWVGGDEAQHQPRGPAVPGHLFVAAYGQSFLRHMVLAAGGQDPAIEYRFVGGPAAPLNHLYKRYQLDRREHQARVVVMGVLASSLRQLTTLTPMTSGFEAPTPYTYPRYWLDGGHLREEEAPLADLPALRRALQDPSDWARLRDRLRRMDSAFYPVVFDRDPFDASTIGRMIRRALGHREGLRQAARYHGEGGFTNADGLLDVGRALLVDFAHSARADGRLPMVVLIDDRGYPGHLEAAFASALDQEGIPYLGTAAIASASDPASFIADGHFTPEVDRRLAAAFLERLHAMTGTTAGAATAASAR
jgi:hypothetical protein